MLLHLRIAPLLYTVWPDQDRIFFFVLLCVVLNKSLLGVLSLSKRIFSVLRSTFFAEVMRLCHLTCQCLCHIGHVCYWYIEHSHIATCTSLIYLFQKINKQAGAELCQAHQSLSLDLDTNLLGLITEPAVAGARSLAERQLKIYLHKDMVQWMKWDLRPALAVYILARI